MATTVNNEGEGEEDHYHHCRHQLPADEIEVATVTSNIQSWYDAGLPFFTKERLQILDRGMRSLKGLPGPVSIPTLNNTLETFHVRTGQVVRKQGIVERIAIWPQIRYLGIDEILDKAKHNSRNAYVNIRIGDVMGPWRNVFTKEPCEPQQKRLRSQAETEWFFAAKKTAWDQSNQCRDLNTLLSSKPHLKVKTIVAFANGSMASESTEVHGQDRSARSAYQHALMLTLRDLFGAEWCLAQEPAYEDADKLLLAYNGVHIAIDPDGFLVADENTAVISISPDIAVKQVLFDLTSPAIFISRKLEEPVREWVTDPDSTRVMKIMEEKYDCHKFPGGLEQYFGNIVIYTRKPCPPLIEGI